MNGREGMRRLVHVGFGVGAWLLPLLGWEVVAFVCAAGVLFNALLLPRLPMTRVLLREGADSGHRGIVLYPLVLFVAVCLFRERHAPTQVAWCALAIGDGLAPVLGRWLRAPSWPWNPDKTVTASLAAFALAAVLAQSLVPPTVAWSAMGVAVLFESLPGPVDDNLTVPASAAATAWLLGGLG